MVAVDAAYPIPDTGGDTVIAYVLPLSQKVSEKFVFFTTKAQSLKDSKEKTLWLRVLVTLWRGFQTLFQEAGL